MKKTTIVIIVVLMLIAICIFAFMGNKKNESKENLKQNANEQIDGKKIEKDNDILNNIEEEIITNEIDENETNTEENENNQSTEKLDEEPKSAEEKAIDIVKKDWNDENAEYSIQGMDNNGSYIVTVTDSATTETLAFYSVNIKDSTFSKREIN